jgi:putative MATE family efflux protein
MRIQLSDHFTYKILFRFTLPTIGMMLFTSVYSIVDGLFVSNLVGKTPFAALNLIFPFIQMLSAFGFMIGSGGSAMVSRLLGQKDDERANQVFSLLVYFALAIGIVLAVLGLLFIRKVSLFLGASDDMLDDCVLYGSICLAALPAAILQFTFNPMMITAERPNMGFWVTIGAGLMNMAMDALFIAVFHWGLAGAAIATGLSQCVGGFVPLIYFSRKNTSLLRLGRPAKKASIIGNACANGSSELLSNISMSIVSMLYNYQLMRYLGEDGVAALGVILYVNFIFLAIFIGYSSGVGPVIGYNFGAQNHKELQNIFHKSVRIIAVAAIVMTASAEILAGPLSSIFVGYDPGLYALTKKAFRIYSISFLLCGFNIFGSALFTSLSNGVISAIISFFRTLVCEVAAVMLLPLIFGIDGIWSAIIAAEIVALSLTTFFVFHYRSRYHYF